MSSSSSQQAQVTGSQVDEAVAAASRITSNILTRDAKVHAIIGGQALKLLGNDRRTSDVDILVDRPAIEIRARLLQLDNRYSINSANKLVFKAGNNISIEVELLQGGPNLSMALPNPDSAPKVLVDSVYILHPKVLIITKTKRWMHIADSTRPTSISKANSDLIDIMYLLRWLADHNQQVDFDYYAAFTPKVRLLLGFRQLYSKGPAVKNNLQRVLRAADFQYSIGRIFPRLVL